MDTIISIFSWLLSFDNIIIMSSLASSFLITFFTWKLSQIATKQQELESRRQEMWEQSHYPDFHIYSIDSGIEINIYNNSTFSIKLASVRLNNSEYTLIKPRFIRAKNSEELSRPASTINSPSSTISEKVDRACIPIECENTTPIDIEIAFFIQALNRSLCAHIKIANKNDYQINYS